MCSIEHAARCGHTLKFVEKVLTAKIKMDAASTVYTYSPLQSKEAWRPSLFHRAHQSIVESPTVTAFVLIVIMLLSFLAGGVFMYVSVCSSHYHDALEQKHQMDIVNTSCSGECEETKHSLLQCFHTIEAINFTVNNVGNSKAHLLQLKSDIKKEIATSYLKLNESLIPHTRRRPPVDAWNT